MSGWYFYTSVNSASIQLCPDWSHRLTSKDMSLSVRSTSPAVKEQTANKTKEPGIDKEVMRSASSQRVSDRTWKQMSESAQTGAEYLLATSKSILKHSHHIGWPLGNQHPLRVQQSMVQLDQCWLRATA